MEFKINSKFYSKEAVMKAAYTYIDKYYIHLDVDNKQEYYKIYLEAKQDSTTEPCEKEFENELLIQQIRSDVWEKTSSLRKMIYARALASTIIECPDYENNWSQGQTNEDSILKDWFDENEL